MRDDWVEVTFDAVMKQSKEKHKPEQEECLFYIGLEHIQKATGLLADDVGIAQIKTVKNTFTKGRWRKYSYEEIIARDKTSLDNLPDPDIPAGEIIDNLESGLAA